MKFKHKALIAVAIIAIVAAVVIPDVAASTFRCSYWGGAWHCL